MKKLILIAVILFTGCVTNIEEPSMVKASGVIININGWIGCTDILCDDGYTVRIDGTYYGDTGDSVKVIAKIK